MAGVVSGIMHVVKKMHFVNQNCGLYGCKRFDISSMSEKDYVNIHIIVHIDTYSVCTHIYIYVYLSDYKCVCIYSVCVFVCLSLSLCAIFTIYLPIFLKSSKHQDGCNRSDAAPSPSGQTRA